jgi:hypothetical protein
MGQWSRDELVAAFERYQEVVVRAAGSGDWAPFADLFTEDSTYIEHAYGEWSGREQTRSWVIRTMTTFPGNAMVSFVPDWATIDEERGWVICDIRNVMRDPGDGSEHAAGNLTILRYAGDGLWANEEDVYNPAKFLTMVREWCRVAEAHDNLPEEARAWLEVVG